MTHQRQNIREAIVSILKTAAISGVGDNVYSDRNLPYDGVDLPVINVIALPEQSEPLNITNKKLMRNLDVTVEAVAANADSDVIDDTCDDLAEAIEATLSNDQTWTDTVLESSLSSTELTVGMQGEIPIGRLTMKYTARYIA